MIILYLFLLAFVAIESHALLLRGGTSNETLREVAQSLDDTFDCYLYLIDGHAGPGIDVEEEWSCVFKGSDVEPVHTYSFEGDFENIMKERFGDDVLDIGGVLKLIVPRVAVVDSSIMIYHKGIDVSHDRRKRQLASLRGVHYVLIVRVTDTFGHKPKHWKNDLKRIFFQDGNNLKNRIEACSNGKLRIEPATATGSKAYQLTHGVINIELDIDVSSSSESWRTVGDKASTKLEQLQNINLSFTTTIFILPDEVDFEKAFAYGQVGGDTIWIKNEYASYPSIQVHEFGHNLGQEHSGKGNSAYGDNTCYMGAKDLWDNVGARMCFNAAKTYYFGWFSEWHKEVYPWNTPFNGYLVGIDDASNGRAGSSKVILKFSQGGKHYFAMFNRKKGINDQVISGANKVMITEQNGRKLDSHHKGDLSPGEKINIGNIVVKFCHIDYGSNGDRAKVLVHPQGQSLQCGTPPNNGNGNGNGNGGAGGVGSCQNIPGWEDGYLKDCNWYKELQERCNWYGNDLGSGGKTPRQACCACGKSNNSGCIDDDSWHDGEDPRYTCSWYRRNPQSCNLFGDKNPRGDGRTANDVCCACQR